VSINGFYTSNDATTLEGNLDMSGSLVTVLGGNSNLTSLRFNASGARSIDVNGKVLTTGGILVTSKVGPSNSTVSGGTLQSAAGTANQDLVLIQNNPEGALVIGAAITDNITNGVLASALTKSGVGTVDLTNANSYTGQTSVVQGVLKLSHMTALPGGLDSTTATAESNLLFREAFLVSRRPVAISPAPWEAVQVRCSLRPAVGLPPMVPELESLTSAEAPLPA
jgi:autotransporter-associated beta strand protein